MSGLGEKLTLQISQLQVFLCLTKTGPGQKIQLFLMMLNSN